MDIQSAYSYLKENNIYPEDIWGYIEAEENDSQWFFDALIDICSTYDILSSDQYPDNMDESQLEEEVLDYFGYDQEMVLEELLKVAPEDKIMEDFILLASGYELEL